MKISIITVVLNAESTIEQTIQSVITQKYADIEYIIIDGGSTDQTLSIIKKYEKRVAIMLSEPDNGIYDAMNKGIKLATGDVIGILNSDDWYEQDTISKVMQCFEQRDTDIVYGDIRLWYEKGRSADAPKCETLDKIWQEMCINHPACFVKRYVYEKLGGFDISYSIAADYEFILRSYVKSTRFTYLPCMLTNFRMTGVSNKRFYECGEEVYKISMKYLSNAPDKKNVAHKIKNRINDIRFLELQETLDINLQKVCEEVFQSQKQSVIIWGIGKIGQRWIEIFNKLGIPVMGLCDSNVQIQGTRIGQYIVQRPHVEKFKGHIVYVSIKEISDDHKKQIEELRQKKISIITYQELRNFTLKNANLLCE